MENCSNIEKEMIEEINFEELEHEEPGNVGITCENEKPNEWGFTTKSEVIYLKIVASVKSSEWNVNEFVLYGRSWKFFVQMNYFLLIIII